MLLVGLFEIILNILKVCLFWLYLPDFNLSTTFAPYLNWFNGLLGNVISLIHFMIPKPVFQSALLIGIFIHEFDHIVLIVRWVLGLLPFIRLFNSF